jgi:hypothetical protein
MLCSVGSPGAKGPFSNKSWLQECRSSWWKLHIQVDMLTVTLKAFQKVNS